MFDKSRFSPNLLSERISREKLQPLAANLWKQLCTEWACYDDPSDDDVSAISILMTQKEYPIDIMVNLKFRSDMMDLLGYAKNLAKIDKFVDLEIKKTHSNVIFESVQNAHRVMIIDSGFLPVIFSGRQNLLLCQFSCYANLSIVFGPNFKGGKSLQEETLPHGGAPMPPPHPHPHPPPVEGSQDFSYKVTIFRNVYAAVKQYFPPEIWKK